MHLASSCQRVLASTGSQWRRLGRGMQDGGVLGRLGTGSRAWKNETLLFASNKFAQMAWCVHRIESGIALEKQNLIRIKQIKPIVQSCPTLLILPSEHGTSSLPFSVNRSGIHQQLCSSVKVRRCVVFVMLF